MVSVGLPEGNEDGSPIWHICYPSSSVGQGPIIFSIDKIVMIEILLSNHVKPDNQTISPFSSILRYWLCMFFVCVSTSGPTRLIDDHSIWNHKGFYGWYIDFSHFISINFANHYLNLCSISIGPPCILNIVPAFYWVPNMCIYIYLYIIFDFPMLFPFLP